MKKLILIVGLLVALSGLLRTVDAQTTTSIVGYGSALDNKIHLINLETATWISSFTVGVPLQGLAIDPAGTTLYGTDQNGILYSVDITTETITTIGSTGLGGGLGIEALDFNFNATELWATNANPSAPAIYSINIDPTDTIIDATPALIQTPDPTFGGTVRAMTADTTDSVWIANDLTPFEAMGFQSFNTAIISGNVTRIGFLDGDTVPFPFPVANPNITGMDRAANGVLYGLSNVEIPGVPGGGGVYIINQEPSVINGGTLDETITPRLSLVGTIADPQTGAAIQWLGLAISTATATSPTPGAGSHNAVGELKIEDEHDIRIGNGLDIKTYNTDPDLVNIWHSLFGVDPGTSPDDIVTLQGPNRTVTWEAGTLVMGGLMTIKVMTDKKDPTVKNIKIEKAGMSEGTTSFISGTGGVNPNLANGGWHEVTVEKMNNVTMTFDGYTITGFLEELEVELDEDGTTAFPLVEEFELKVRGVTSAPDVKKGYVSSVVINVPGTVVTAIAGAEYEEETDDSPAALSGHIAAEFEREYCAQIEGVDISSLIDGNNNKLKRRKGPCVIDDAL